MLETLDYTIRIGSTPTFLYFDLFISYIGERGGLVKEYGGGGLKIFEGM